MKVDDDTLAYNVHIWRTSCEAPLVPPILSNSPPYTSLRVRQSAGVHANGNGGKIARFASAGDCAGGHSPVLRKPARPSHPLGLSSLRSATAGGSQFLLTVNRDDFRHDSVVNWNGSFVVTTFVSIHQLFAATHNLLEARFWFLLKG